MTLVDPLSERGVDAVLVGNREVKATLVEEHGVLPAFALGCDEMPPQVGGGGLALRDRPGVTEWHGRSIASDLRTLHARLRFDSRDRLIFNSMRQWALAGLASWIESQPGDALPKIGVILHYTPMPGGNARALERVEYREALRAFAALPYDRRPTLFTDSVELQAEFQALTDITVAVLPIPHCPKPQARISDGKRLRITFAGQARKSKGFGLLPGAFASVKDIGNRPATFRAQCYDGDYADEAFVGLIASLRGLGVELVSKPLSEAGYARLLAESDILVLPYDGETYRSQTSGVLAEALALGRPVVVTEGTWMAAQVSSSGGGEVFDGTEADLSRAILTIMQDYELYNNAASAFSQEWVKFHNPRTFIDVIQHFLAIR